MSPSLPRRPPREEDFTGRLRDERVASWLGVALGVAFGIAFVTGVLSHLIQHPPWWFGWPTRPVSLYRVTQGLHVIAGTVAIPLLLAKLYSVYPKLFTWPPVRSMAHALERASVLLLVASAFFELATGLLNIAQVYPWSFFFPAAHYAAAYVVMGSILVHVAVKLPVIRRALGERLDQDEPVDGLPGRRTFLVGTGAAALAAYLATAGQTVPLLRRVSVLAPRSGGGSQGLPVNKSAVAAGVVESARDAGYRLVVRGRAGEVRLALADLQAMPQHEEDLPIACVEGWSATGRWTGVRVSDLLDLVGAPSDADVEVASLQQRGLYRASVLPGAHARDPLTLLALRLNGEPLDLDHGYPCRVIAPSRPGVLQTKWVSSLRVPA